MARRSKHRFKPKPKPGRFNPYGLAYFFLAALCFCGAAFFATSYLARRAAGNAWEPRLDSRMIALAIGLGLVGLALLVAGLYAAFLPRDEYEKRTHWDREWSPFGRWFGPW